MKRIITVAYITLACLAQAATNTPPVLPPTPGPAPTVPTYNPRHIVWRENTTNVVGGVTNVVSIRVVERPMPEPTHTTIRLKFHDKLNTNALYTVDFTCPRNCAFAGWEIIEK